MSRGRAEMKAQEPLVESLAPDNFAVFIEDSWHLPPGGDQSWRETDALRIFGNTETSKDPEKSESPEKAKTEPPSTDFVPEREFAPDAAAQGWGGVVAALLLVPAIALVIALLAFPDILTAGYWRPHVAVPRPASVAAHVAHAPAPLRASLDAAKPASTPNSGASNVLVIDATPRPQSAPPDSSAAADGPDSSTAEATQPAPTGDPDVNKSAVTGAVAEAAPLPRHLPKRHAAKHQTVAEQFSKDHDTGGFYAMVPGPDGVLRYQYFPSHPTR